MDSIAAATLNDPFYYLRNFQMVLDWVACRHGDLLTIGERDRIAAFQRLPRAARALLVRMVMRKGEHFRAGKLRYPEIGPPGPVLRVLVTGGWVERCRVERADVASASQGLAGNETSGKWTESGMEPGVGLTVDELFRLYTRAELAPALDLDAAGRKSDWLAALRERFPQPRPFTDWDPRGLLEPPYRLTVMPLCERLRLMFFGNLHQDWSEFVLTELGTFRYESVALNAVPRPFQRRQEVDTWLRLHECRDRFEAGEPLDAIEQRMPAGDTGNPWVEERRHRLCYKLARQWERQGALAHAEALYRQCCYPGARSRRMRVMERRGAYQAALTLAGEATAAPESEAERQYLARLLPRLHRKLGLPKPVAASPPDINTWRIELPPSGSVEGAVADYLQRREPGAPVFYVENTLLTGLFGLLCWEAIFAPVPGAFFHPFQRGPLDLHAPAFHERRRALFEDAFASLDRGEHGGMILETFRAKAGMQSPFVHWGALSEPLLETALACIPAAHLKACFERLLRDIKANRAGLPDLIRFWPARGRYQMIEVKGPGDRLRDNQRRWLAFFAEHAMPAMVCKVDWRSEDGTP